MNAKAKILIGLMALAICIGGLQISLAETAAAAIPIDPRYYPPGAATISGEKPVPDQNEFGSSTDVVKTARDKLTYRIISWILGFAGVVAVYFIAMNGWALISSGGKEESITEGKKGLTWAVIGLILIILSYSIVQFIVSLSFSADESSNPSPPTAGAPGP